MLRRFRETLIRPRTIAWRYAFAVAAAALATAGRLVLDPWLDNHAPYIVYVLAVTVTVWLAGFWPSMLTAALSVPPLVYFLAAEPLPLPAKLIGAAIYAVSMLAVALLGGSMRAAEAKALRSRQFLRATLDALPMKLAVLDSKGVVVATNHRWAELHTGLDYLAFSRKAAAEGDSTARDALASLLTVLDGRSAEAWSEYPCEQDGQRLWFLMRVSDAPQVLGGGLVVAHVDITERKHLEDTIRRSEARFRELADAMPQIVWSAGPDGKVDYLNRRWHELSGVPPGEVGEESWLAAVHPDDRDRAIAGWRQAVAAGKPLQMEIRLRMAGQDCRWHLARALPVHDEHGGVLRWYGTCTDIHDLKAAEGRLQVAAAELSRSNIDLEQFAYVASHDLQEPLRQVSGHLGLIRKRMADKLAPVERDLLGFAIDGATRMAALISDLLAYSRVGRGQSGFSDVDMEAALRTAVANLSTAIRESGAVITHDPLPTIRASQALMPQLLQNLLGNAIKYRHAQRPPRIHFSAVDNGDHWLFSIRDNGIGIPPHEQGRIFAIFYRLHGRKDYSGTGIGLAICKRIVEHHCGRIWVESDEGQGATFHFTIPRLVAAGASAAPWGGGAAA
jgi:PAS domain S-box-containing protein